MPKQFLNNLILWNDKIESDIIGAQLSIFTHWLNNPSDSKINEIINSNAKIDTGSSSIYVPQSLGDMLPDDLQLWNSLMAENKMYEFIAEKLQLSSRGEAKSAVFNIIFSKYRYNTSNKAKLKKIFPTVIKMMDEFKKYCGNTFLNGQSVFANTLSNMESYIVVDNLLPAILKSGYHCISKHDSLIYDKKDYKAVNKIIVDKLGELNYKLSFRDNYIAPCIYVPQCLHENKKPTPAASKNVVSATTVEVIGAEYLSGIEKGYHLPSDEQLGIKPLEQRNRELWMFESLNSVYMRWMKDKLAAFAIFEKDWYFNKVESIWMLKTPAV